MTNIGVAFKSFNDLEARVPVTSSVAVSSIAHMHEDIKAAAERTQSSVLVLPYKRAGALGNLLDFPGSGLNQVGFKKPGELAGVQREPFCQNAGMLFVKRIRAYAEQRAGAAVPEGRGARESA